MEYRIAPDPAPFQSSFRLEPVWTGAFRGSSTSTPFSFASERLPCGKGVHVISPANDLSILDRDDGHESVVIRSARFDGFAEPDIPE